MREILFRGKRTDNGEWVKGYVFSDDLIHSNKMFVGAIVIENNEITGHSFYEIIPETISEFTGLTDKNGTKIFEGDIVKDCYGEVELCYYHEEKHRFIFDATHFIRELEVANRVECEVIGNIHDNPELLAEK